MASHTVVATSEAYTKALLHAYKYPTQAVMGFIAGKRMTDGSSNSSSSAASACYVADVFPISHTVPIAAPHPMLEVAYAHCQAAAKANGSVLLGVYFANERVDDRSISTATTRTLLEFMATRLGTRPLVWFLDNAKLVSPPTAVAVSCFVDDGGSNSAPSGTGLGFGVWNAVTLEAEATVTEETAMESVTNALESFAHYRLMDLEEHLENPKVDYLVQPLEKLMSRK